MNKSDRVKLRDSIISSNRHAGKIRDDLQDLYEKYIRSAGYENQVELFDALTRFGRPIVGNVLRNYDLSLHDYLEDALQEGLLEVSMALKKHLEQGACLDYFPNWAKIVFRNRAMDYCRKETRNPHGITHWRPEESSFLSNTDDDPWNMKQDPGPGPEKEVIQTEWSFICHQLFRLYCDAMLEESAKPQSSLALHYCRVCPQMLGELPHTITSVKWAFIRMEELTMAELKVKSEQELRDYFDAPMQWGDGFSRQLKEMFTREGRSVPLADVVYTRAFNRKEVNRWALNAHVNVLKATKEKVSKLPKLRSAVIRSVEENDVIYKSLFGGEHDR